MSFKFNRATAAKAAAILRRYPYKQSAVMPFLTLAQKQCGGSLSEEAMRYVAEQLDMPAIRVFEVATFYDMYHTEPVGRHHLAFCNSISCWLRGSGDLIKLAEGLTGARFGKMSKDGQFSLAEAPCLGACINAPVVMLNAERYVEELTTASLTELIASLRASLRASRPKKPPRRPPTSGRNMRQKRKTGAAADA